MYDCSFTEWDASEMGPKRDIIEELRTAARKRGMKFGVSSHRAFNWKYFVRRPEFDSADPKYARLYGRPMPFLFKEDAADYKKRFEPQDQQFKEDWLARTCELVDKYDPDLVWFDFGITNSQETTFAENHFSPYLKRFAAYYYNVTSKREGPLGIINYKWQAFPEGAAVLDLERSTMDAIRTPFWQTDTAISSSSWGYTENQKYRTAGRLVDDLVDIASKNGCLLLNVGPRADGTIPEKDREILLSVGNWLRVNGEAIYGTTYWKTYGEGPTKTTTGHLAEHNSITAVVAMVTLATACFAVPTAASEAVVHQLGGEMTVHHWDVLDIRFQVDQTPGNPIDVEFSADFASEEENRCRSTVFTTVTTSF